jgi:enoyl-CoA hydratase/carnithine racemase
METILHSVTHRVATITLNRPAQKNALNRQMSLELREAVAHIANDAEIGALILTGSGDAFCSGGDLRTFGKDTSLDELHARMIEVHDWIRQLLTLEIPVIAAVDGPAFGAGFGIALTADFIVASERARFCMAFGRVGLIPDAGSFHTLSRVVGPYRARQIMLTTRQIEVTEAHELGIVYEIVRDEGRTLARARQIAEALARTSPAATRCIKHTLAGDAHADLDAVLQMEAATQTILSKSAYFNDAANRFVTKQALAFEWPAALEPDDSATDA